MKRTGVGRKKPQRVDLADVGARALEPKRKPMRKAKPAVAAAQYAQRRALTLRSGSRCEAEIPTVINGVWNRCGAGTAMAAHIYQRPRCGKARDLVAAVIHVCRAHNIDHLTWPGKCARAPLRYAQAAWDAILGHSTLGIDADDRERIHIGSIGPRPEKGSPPYD